jgi:uncharacterized protein (DUF1330 family)
MTDALERCAADHAPSESKYERLLIAAKQADDPQRRIEDRFITYATGRLTFRSGEVLHFNEDWVDTDRQMIKIPSYEDCRCRYCRERVQSIVEDRNDVDVEEALEFYWQPKYQASARGIPYGFSDRAIEIVETFVEEVGELDVCQSTINRRVDTLQERAGLDGDLYPHALRAAAGLYWAMNGLEATFLQSMMGWKDLTVANRYLRMNASYLDDRLEQLASTNEIRQSDGDTGPEDLPDPSAAVYDAVGEESPEGSTESDYLPSPADQGAGTDPRDTTETTLDDFGVS